MKNEAGFAGHLLSKLNSCAAAMLPFVPPFPGAPWFDIIQCGPRQSNGHIIPKRYAIDPLVRDGLVAINPGRPKRNGGRHWDRYYRVEETL